MKKIKVKKVNFFNIKGMALLEFIIVIIAVFLVVGIFIEMGHYLKSEAAVVGFTRMAAREVQVSGELSESYAKDLATRLNNEGIRNVQIKVFNTSISSSPVVANYSREQDGDGAISNEDYSGSPMGFRRDFKIVIKGQHPLREVSLAGVNTIGVPVVFSVDGKVEKFRPE